MITTTRRQCIIFILLSLFTRIQAQDFRAFNQNASRNNNTRSTFNSDTWNFGVNSGAAFGINSNENTMFRGNSMATKLFGQYYFGKIGLGLSSGIIPGSISNNSLNDFVIQRKFPQNQLQVSNSKPFNSYLLFGPTVHFGNRIQIAAELQGGMFLNNSGNITIGQSGAARPFYRFDAADKNLFPGFSGTINIAYPISEGTKFFISTDYLQSRSTINLFDPQRGIDVPTEQNRDIKLFTAGIGITRSFGNNTRRVLPTVNKREIMSSRDMATGQSTGRLLPTVNKKEIISSRDAQSGQSTGRLLPTVNKKNIAIDESGVHRNLEENCGPVTTKITKPDGTTEEMTFACSDDAAAYTEKINPGKQKNWLPANFRMASGGNDRGIISGRLTWPSANTAMGIVTNKNIERGGSTTMNSQTSSTRTTPSTSFGTMVRISAREAGSGMATGKRSREAGSGLATGRRQYEPIFIENEEDVCNPCLATAKLSSVKNNPLYSEKNQSGVNPLYKKNEKTTAGMDEDCDGIGGIDVYLIDPNSETVLSKTKTEACGNFFFANVPAGNYVVKVNGVFAGKKGYDIYMKSKTDLAGSIEQTNEPVQLFLNTEGSNDDMNQKAGISTSRSNLRTKSFSITEADLDGDGELESLKVLAELNDGTIKDVTALSRISNAGLVKKVTVRGWDPEKKQAIIGSANSIKEQTITINDNNEAVFTKQYDNGTKEETRVTARMSNHPNVVQFIVPVEPDNDDAVTDQKIKTKSNIKNDRMMASNTSEEEIIWSPKSNIKMLNVASGDVNGDGKAEMLIGGAIPGGSVISAARRPGDPIPGIDVKLGKNPGGQMLSTVAANEYGEFEFTNIEAGDYFITVEQNIIIDDETIVTVGGDYAGKNINTSEDNLGSGNLERKGWDGTIKGNSKNINTSEANIGKDNLMNKGWDGTIKGKIINSGNNGVILMDIDEPVTFRWTPLVPKPKEPVTYRLRVWQLMEGQNGTQAMRANNPIIEKTITNTNEASIEGIYTGPCKPPYLCDFIWSVQAINKEGKIVNSESKYQGNFSIRQQDTKEANIDKDNLLNKGWDGTVKGKIINSGSIEAITMDADEPVTFRWTPLVPKPKEPVTYRLRVWQLMQGQNGTQAMRSNNPIIEKTITNTTEASMQGIYTGPCKPPYLCDFIWSVQAINKEGKSISSQYDNQVWRFSINQPDNRESSVTKEKVTNSNVGPVKWMAPEAMKTAINTSHSNIKNMLSSLNTLEEQINEDQGNAKSIINTSRSNIKSQRAAMNDLEQTLDNLETIEKNSAMKELEQKRNEADLQFLKLQESLQDMGTQYSSISNVLKTRHDIAMNSIRNMK